MEERHRSEVEERKLKIMESTQEKNEYTVKRT